jgi:phosphoribosylglycinamide formyltransferase-1
MAKPKSPTKEHERLARLLEIARALPEAVVEPKGDHATFTVRKKVFAYYLRNHHGDGIVSVCFRAEPGANRDLVAADPERFYLPAYIGARGWGALRLDRGKVSWSEVEQLVSDSYRLAAPKRLAASLHAEPVRPAPKRATKR